MYFLLAGIWADPTHRGTLLVPRRTVTEEQLLCYRMFQAELSPLKSICFAFKYAYYRILEADLPVCLMRYNPLQFYLDEDEE